MIDRMPALEMAYNVNDCVELALGRAGEERRGVDVQAACAAAQRAKMAEYRAWFHERRRPRARSAYRKSADRFSEKIVFHQKVRAPIDAI